MTIPDHIDTERLVLRPLSRADGAAFVEFMTDAATTSEFMFCDEQKTVSGARAFFEAITGSYATAAPYFVLSISERDESQLSGLCGISNLPGDRVFDCFCCLRPDKRGNGYATEAIAGLVGFCFREHIVGQFHLYINPRNHRSVRLAERLKCDYQGQQKHPLNGDACVLYVLRSRDWRSAQ